MTEQELIQAIHAIAEQMAQTFSAYSTDVLKAFAKERLASSEMFRDIAASSEQRLGRANAMVSLFGKSADAMTTMLSTISTEYVEHIRKLTDERDKLLEMNAKQQAYIEVLQNKVDDRDDHIKSLLAQNAQQSNATAQLIQRLTAAPQAPLVHNDFGPRQ